MATVSSVLVALLMAAAPAARAQGQRVTARDIVGLIERGRLDRAETLLRYQVDRAPTPLAEYLLGHVLVERFHFDEAEPLLRRALEARPERAAWRHDLARTLLGQGRCTAAIVELDRCIAADPRPVYRYDKAMCALNVGDEETAERELVAALDGGWQSAGAWLALGRLHADRGEDERARGAYERALEIEPDHPEATYGLAVVEARTGSGERAIALFRAVLERVPGHLGAAYGLGRALIATGAVEEGRAALMAFERLSRREELIENRRTYLAHDPESVDVRLELASLLLESGRPADASRVLQEAARIEPRREETWRLLLESYRLEGREADAARVVARLAGEGS